MYNEKIRASLDNRLKEVEKWYSEQKSALLGKIAQAKKESESFLSPMREQEMRDDIERCRSSIFQERMERNPDKGFIALQLKELERLQAELEDSRTDAGYDYVEYLENEEDSLLYDSYCSRQRSARRSAEYSRICP